MAMSCKCLCQALRSGPVDVLIESREISLQNGPASHQHLKQLYISLIRTQADHPGNAVQPQKLKLSHITNAFV